MESTNKMEFSLNCNINVSVGAFTCTKTYVNILAISSPTDYTNNLLVKELIVPKDWGERKLLILPPTAEQLKTLLPSYRYFLWLDSDYKNNPKVDGSELVVAFFDESPTELAIKDIFQSRLEEINWKDNAEDFEC